MKKLRIFYKAALFTLWCILIVPLQWMTLQFTGGKGAYTLPYFWHNRICRIFGLKAIVEGTPMHDRQTLFVCNHVSYLDIPVMASVLRASFVAKKEVAGWPVFGTLARLQQTAFISRSRNDAQKEKNALTTMLDSGKSVILFPEGTSTDGRDVVPFKSSLFSMTLDGNRKGMLIQPVTLVVESVDGRSAEDQSVRDLYAWYGDMTMPPHLNGFTASKGAVIRLVFHAPIDPAAYEDRKTLADDCWRIVQSGLGQQKLAGGLAA
ncbi:MAG: acyltransferase family protein [Micavibrio sp.]|nr:acyltransferase family protein [Micavibrio sp.]